MKAHTVTGAEVEISVEEVQRLATLAGWKPGIRPEGTHLKKALDDIERVFGCRPETEPELEEAMFQQLPLGTREETHKFYEAVEGIIEMHFAMRNI